MFEILDIMMSEDDNATKAEKLGNLMKKQTQKLSDLDKRTLGSQIAFDRLDGLSEAALLAEDDIVTDSAMKATLAVVMATVLKKQNVNPDLLHPGQGESLTEEIYRDLCEKVSQYARDLQARHDSAELN